MKKLPRLRRLNLLSLAMASCLISSFAIGADPVFRCGPASSPVYSQKPCADGKAVQVDDARTPQQKAESQAAARMQAKTADRMEKDRLAQEAAWAKANNPPATAKTAKAPRAKASAPKGKGASKGEEKLPIYVPFKPAPKKS